MIRKNKKKGIDNMSGGVVGLSMIPTLGRLRTRSYKLITLAVEASLGFTRPLLKRAKRVKVFCYNFMVVSKH